MAVQRFYPDHYNGAFAACPDPVDFRAFTLIDLYKDKNAYFLEGVHKRVAQPGMRDYLGHATATQQDLNYYELALGTKSRSGEQYDIWQAVYSPLGSDGYPAPGPPGVFVAPQRRLEIATRSAISRSQSRLSQFAN